MYAGLCASLMNPNHLGLFCAVCFPLMLSLYWECSKAFGSVPLHSSLMEYRRLLNDRIGIEGLLVGFVLLRKCGVLF